MPLNQIYLRNNVVIFDLTKPINSSLKSIRFFSMKFVSFQINVSNKLLMTKQLSKWNSCFGFKFNSSVNSCRVEKCVVYVWTSVRFFFLCLSMKIQVLICELGRKISCTCQNSFNKIQSSHKRTIEILFFLLSNLFCVFMKFIYVFRLILFVFSVVVTCLCFGFWWFLWKIDWIYFTIGFQAKLHHLCNDWVCNEWRSIWL